MLNEIIDRINRSDIGKRMATGAFWSFTGTALAKFLILVSGVVCARILTQQQYGQLGIVRSTVNMFVVFGSAGLGMTAAKYISEYRNGHTERISSIYQLTNGFALFAGVIVTSVIIALAPVIAEKTLDSPELSLPLRLGAFMLFLTVLNEAQNGTLSGLEDFRSIAMNTLWGSIAESVMMIGGAYYFGINGAVAGYGIGFVVLYITNRISIKGNFRRMNISVSRETFNKDDLHLLYRFSLPACLSLIVIPIAYWVIKTILVRESGFEQMAVYEAADEWKIIILFIPKSISRIVLPILSNTGTDDYGKFWHILKINLLLNGGVAFSVALIVCIFSRFIMELYGSGYSDPTTLIALAVAAVLSALSNVVGLSISSRAKMWAGFAFNLIWAVMVVLFSHLFVGMNLGAKGLAYAILCSYTIHTVIQFIYLSCIIPKKQNHE